MNRSQLAPIGVGVALILGFEGTFVIMKVLDVLRRGLDIDEHAEHAYSEEREFEKCRT